MTGCCCSRKGIAETTCPGHGGSCREVPYRTVLHHLKQPWRAGITEQRYFFCDEAGCPVVYFGEDGRCFEGDALRERVGQKEKGAEDMLCYCFDIRYGEGANDPTLKAFVIDKTSAGLCNCEVRNPAGRCCLKDFPE